MKLLLVDDNNLPIMGDVQINIYWAAGRAGKWDNSGDRYRMSIGDVGGPVGAALLLFGLDSLLVQIMSSVDFDRYYDHPYWYVKNLDSAQVTLYNCHFTRALDLIEEKTWVLTDDPSREIPVAHSNLIEWERMEVVVLSTRTK